MHVYIKCIHAAFILQYMWEKTFSDVDKNLFDVLAPNIKTIQPASTEVESIELLQDMQYRKKAFANINNIFNKRILIAYCPAFGDVVFSLITP